MASAMSSSIRKGQMALVCQLCENDPKMKCKCLDCGLMMCQRCREKVHPKFSSADDHTIIDIKDIGEHQAESGPKLDFMKIKCPVHNKKYCCLYCKSCDKTVCQTCVAETHNKHDFCEISDAYKNRVEIFRTKQENMTKGVQTLKISLGELRQVKSLEKKSFNKAKQETAARANALVDAVKKHTNKLYSDLDKKFSAISKSIEEEEEKVNKTVKKFQEQNDIINEVLKSDDVEKVFSDSLLKSVKIQVPPINITSYLIPKFTPGDTPDISKLYGKLEDVDVPCNIDLQVIQQYSTKEKDFVW